MNKGDKIILKDVSNGFEMAPIPIVNNFDDTLPVSFHYTLTNTVTSKAESIALEGKQSVPEWKSCCSCEDECKPGICECEDASEVVFSPKHRLVYDPNSVRVYEHKYVNCTLKCSCRMKCGRQLLPNYTTKKTFLKYVPGKGFGVFAAQPISVGQPVCEYVGKVALRSEGNNPDTAYQFLTHVYGDTADDEVIVDAIDQGNVSRFFNHCCLPNLSPIRFYNGIPDSTGIYPLPRVAMVAVLNIKPGDELTFSYGATYFSDINMPCLCYGNICYCPPEDYLEHRESHDSLQMGIEENNDYVNHNYDRTADIEPVCEVID